MNPHSPAIPRAQLDRAIEQARLAGDMEAVSALQALPVADETPPVTGAYVTRSLLGGATLGFGDELRAGTNAAINSAFADAGRWFW